MEKTPEAILENAILAARKINQPAARSLALAQISAMYARQGNTAQSLAMAAEVLKVADTIKYPHEKAKCLAAAAEMLACNGQTQEAAEQFTRALRLARAAETATQSIEALFRIAVCYVDAGLADEGFKLLQELRSLVIQPESEVDTAAELVNIAELMDDLGQKQPACEVLSEALSLTRQIPDNWFRLERLIEIADTYSSCGSEDQALPILQEARLLTDRIEEYSRPYFLLRLVEVFINLKKNDIARDLLGTIPAIIEGEESAYEKAGGFIEIAEQYTVMGEKAAALALLSRSRDLVVEINNPREQISIQTEISEWLDESGQTEEAAQLADLACLKCQELVDKKSGVFCLGKLAVVFVYLKDISRAAQLVEVICQTTRETSIKTAGLGAIGLELAAEGQLDLAGQLAAVIKEPEILVNLYLGMASAAWV